MKINGYKLSQGIVASVIAIYLIGAIIYNVWPDKYELAIDDWYEIEYSYRPDLDNPFIQGYRAEIIDKKGNYVKYKCYFTYNDDTYIVQNLKSSLFKKCIIRKLNNDEQTE